MYINTLSLNIRHTHEILRFHTKQCTNHSRSQTMLARTGFSYKFALTHIFGQQTLSQRIINLMRSAMQKGFFAVFQTPLEIMDHAVDGDRSAEAVLTGSHIVGDGGIVELVKPLVLPVYR